MSMKRTDIQEGTMDYLQLSRCMRLGTAVARHLLQHYGFNARQAERLIDLKIRYECGGLRYKGRERKYLEFYRWLVVHGDLDDDCHPEGEHGAVAA